MSIRRGYRPLAASAVFTALWALAAASAPGDPRRQDPPAPAPTATAAAPGAAATPAAAPTPAAATTPAAAASELPKCGDCHTEKNWTSTQGRFDHERTKFQLRNAHALPAVKCNACHKDLRSMRKTPLDCYSCHKNVNRAYMRPMIPTQPPFTIINFDPAATWPE